MDVQYDKSLIGYGSQELVEYRYGWIAANVSRDAKYDIDWPGFNDNGCC